MNKQHTALGIDIGGSHITAGWVDLLQKKVITPSVVRHAVNRHAPAAEILGVWAATINALVPAHRQPTVKVGFAMPGPFDYENGICLIKGFDKYEALYGMNIRTELSARTGIPPHHLVFRNDADAFLAGELEGGAGKGHSVALGITLGTGLGSCVAMNGNIENATLNEWPYKDTIAEEYVSTRWFIKSYQQHTGKTISGVKELVDRYAADELARLVFDEFSVNFAAVLRHALNRCAAGLVIIGGNISNAFPLFIEQLQKQLATTGAVPLIKQAVLGEDAALVGAAFHQVQHLPEPALTN